MAYEDILQVKYLSWATNFFLIYAFECLISIKQDQDLMVPNMTNFQTW